MKLQINSLAALERLIGGDTEVELEIRNSIVQEFAKKHLKAIVNEGSIQKVAHALDEMLSSQAEAIITAKFGTLSHQYWNGKFVLNDTCMAALNDAADSAFRSYLMNALADSEKKMSERYSEQYISDMINSKVDAEVAKRIQLGVEARIDAIRNSI